MSKEMAHSVFMDDDQLKAVAKEIVSGLSHNDLVYLQEQRMFQQFKESPIFAYHAKQSLEDERETES